MQWMDTLFWLFFAGCALWVAYGFVRVFLWDRSPRPRPSQQPVRAKSAGGGMASSDVTTFAVNTATAPADTSTSMASIESSDSDSSDLGSDSGGGDFSGGGGDYGGGGSGGSWS